MMGLILVIAGLVIWLGLHFEHHVVIGIVLLIVGVVLLFAPGPWYGYGYWRGRRGPMP
jgi:hypothetical protein